MTPAAVTASRTISAPAEAIFAVLVDPASHAAIDGTGWICEPVEPRPLRTVGQIFRMTMFHPDHPDGHYETANRVEVIDPPDAIGWKTGYDADDGTLAFGGWTWRYDLHPAGPHQTHVTLTYDWSAVPEEGLGVQDRWPPFPPEHLDRSLAHLAELTEHRP